jgi:hypothetical protein
MSRRSRRPLAVLLTLVAALAAIALLVVVFFPADRLRGELERQVARATGYAVRIESLGLRLSGFGLGLAAGGVTATAPDSSQRYEIPELRLRVKLLPLLRRQVEATGLEANGLVVTLRPGTGRPDSDTGSAEGGEAGAGAALFLPDVRVRDGRLVQEGAAGTTRLFGVSLDGSYRADAGGGLVSGTMRADSTLFAPRATPDQPLRLPAIDAKFESRISGRPMTVATTIDGRLGPVPMTGTVESREEAAGWRNDGTFTMADTDAAALLPLLPPESAAGLSRYALGGRLENGRLTFAGAPGAAELDYRFTGTLAGLTASLPDKGRVIDSGSASLDVRPDDATLEGALRSGNARLDLVARIRNFAAPTWTATLELVGPAVEALRFAPPHPDLTVRSGSVDARIEASGRVGAPGLPEASGTVRLSEVALSHPAIAVPVDRFDARVTLAGTRLDLADAYVKAGQSEAWFDGGIADWKRPELQVTVQARTLHLDELFPETGSEPAAGTASAGGRAAAQPTPAPPVRGRITIDRLVREDLVLTEVSSNFEADAAGMRLTDLDAKSYGGRVRGDLTLKPEGNAVLDYSGHLTVDDMRAEDLLAAWTPIRGIEGRLDTDLVLSGRNGPGIDAFSVLTLIGKGLVFEGQLVNIPALRKVSEALQFEAGTADRIPFKTLRHSVRIENGFAQLDTLRVSQVNADWTVGGRIGLDGRLDCPVTARLAPTLFRPGSDLAKVADLVAGPDGRVEIGLKLGGTLTSPTVSVDLDPLLKRAREKGKDALEDEVKKRLGDLLRRP